MFDDPRNLRLRQQQDENNAASIADQLTQAQADLSSTKAQLTQTQTDLSTAQAQLAAAQSQVIQLNTTMTGLNASVTQLNASAAAAKAAQFTYNALPGAPVITVIRPSSGTPAGGDTVTITGFTGATAVSFGLTPATRFTVVSDTQITAVTPPGSSGTVNVSVTTPLGKSAPPAPT